MYDAYKLLNSVTFPEQALAGHFPPNLWDSAAKMLTKSE